jgi:CRISPR/Cas system-associated protein Cas10 (large subunit of type III CRISPR-Cas system)
MTPRTRALAIILGSVLCLAGMAAASAPAFAQKKDYLSENEADKIRDAETTSERIKLFISFAADRIKKIQYEFAHPSELHREERVNALINGYSGCIDDGSDLIQVGVDKQQDIRDAIKEMQSRAPEFLAYLKELAAKGQAVAPYKDNLDDAIDATNDAIKDAAEALKENAPPPPVRRRPQ